MRIFFSVGEPSGDLHGANLIRNLKSQTDVTCVGFGGPKMREAGCELHFELTTMAVMFIGAVLKNLRFFFRLIGQADQYFASHPVDAVVLIDYPGFNWWIARKAKRHGIPVFYYGVPQVWAWAPWRVRKIRRLVDHVLCKLPFEVEWFGERNCHATYVGHPYFDQLAQQTYDDRYLQSLLATGEDGRRQPRVTLLPGSRDSEVESVLPILLSVAREVRQRVPECQIAVATYNVKQQAFAQDQNQDPAIAIEVDRTPELMRAADVCVACSGSVSMELLHHRKPTVIVFKIKRWAMWLQAILLRAKYITLVNLIATPDIRKRTWGPYDPDAADAEPIPMPEYLTTGDPSGAIADRVVKWLTDQHARQQNQQQLDALAQKYAQPGATQRAAGYILAALAGVQQVPFDSPVNEQQRRSA